MRVVLAALALAILCTGCASVTQGRRTPVRVDTVTESGERVDGAGCTLRNDRTTTSSASGATAYVRRSGRDLEVTCTQAGQPDARGRLISRANLGMFGNVIAGGVIGAVVDHNTGAAYTYPTWVQLVFGRELVFDRNQEHEGSPMLAPGLPAAAPKPVAAKD